MTSSLRLSRSETDKSWPKVITKCDSKTLLKSATVTKYCKVMIQYKAQSRTADVLLKSCSEKLDKKHWGKPVLETFLSQSCRSRHATVL